MAYKNTVGPTIQFKSYYNSAAVGANTGAQMGSSFGPWGMLIGGIAGTVAGFFNSKAHNDAMKEAAQAQFEAADVANDKNLTALARNLSEVYRERTIEFNRATASLVYLDTKGNEEQAKAENQYAAADQIGNALVYSKADTQAQVDAQKWQTMFNLETAIENTNVKVKSMITNTEGAFYGVNVDAEEDDWVSIFTGAVALGTSAYNAIGSSGGDGGWFQGMTDSSNGQALLGNTSGSSFGLKAPSSSGGGFGLKGSSSSLLGFS